jgi:hypothetical protein
MVAIGGPIASLGKSVCAAIGNFIGVFIRGWMLQAFDGTTGDAGQWGLTIAEALLAASGPTLWEAGINGWSENTLPGIFTSIYNWVINTFVPAVAWLGSTIISGIKAAATFLYNVGAGLANAVRNLSVPTSPSGTSCDIYGFYGTPCAAAYSTLRALSSFYNGPLYQVQRASDGTTADIGLLSAGGYVNAAQQDSFCASTTCTITKVYDQSSNWNDLTVEGAGGAAGADGPASATALPITVDGNEADGIDFTGQVGYRDNDTQSIAANGEPEGMYMVASGTNVNSGCCFDFGNAETNTHDNGNGHMDAVNFSTTCYFSPCTGGGPWVEADMENGLFQGGNGSNTANAGLVGDDFVTAMLKNDGQTTCALEGGNAQSGGLSTWYNGSLPTIGGYKPMQQEASAHGQTAGRVPSTGRCGRSRSPC